MFLINLNAEIVACILSFRKSRHKPNVENTSKYGFSPDLGGKNGGVLSMRMQVILDSSFARPGSAPIWGGKKGEFRDWTKSVMVDDSLAIKWECEIQLLLTTRYHARFHKGIVKGANSEGISHLVKQTHSIYAVSIPLQHLPMWFYNSSSNDQ